MTILPDTLLYPHPLYFRVVKSYVVRPGKDFSTEVTRQETDLTPEMIQR